MSEHTPTPWHVESFDDDFEKSTRIIDVCTPTGLIRDKGGDIAYVSRITYDDDPHESEANAAHIVKCVNERDDLVASIEGLLASIDTASGYLTDLCYSNVFSAEVKQACALIEKVNQS